MIYMCVAGTSLHENPKQTPLFIFIQSLYVVQWSQVKIKLQ